jgi:3-carboxy-cis,cis-muconate cycloisomerase
MGEVSVGLMGPLSGDPVIDELIGDDALVAAMVEVEAALARASAHIGVLPAEAAAVITRSLARVHVDAADLGRRSVAGGNPVVPLVGTLLDALPPTARPWLHYGATSQDILDTAITLTAARAVDVLSTRSFEIARRTARLADAHRDTLMVARTLGQQALPTTFGAKAAGWAAGLLSTGRRLAEIRRDRLAVQLGGAAGTLAVFGADGLQVMAALADELGLVDPRLPWHTERSRVHELAAALAASTAAAGKIATDVILLAQGEVGEVREGGGPGHGGSSAMPQKRNPATSVLVRAAAMQAPGAVATVISAGMPEHERGFGPWHAEWRPLRELVHLAGGAVARIGEAIDHLEVDTERMRANLDAALPGVMAESLASRLAPGLGRRDAQALAAKALAAGDWRRTILDDAGMDIDPGTLESALDPIAYLGSCGQIVDRVLGEAQRAEEDLR